MTTTRNTSAGVRSQARSSRVMTALRTSNTPYTAGFLVLIVVVFTLLSPGAFFTAFNLSNIALDASVFLVLGVGMTFVIITGGIDLSVGSVAVFSGVMSVKAMALVGGGNPQASILTIAVGLIAGLVAGAVWGTLNGLLIAYAKLPALIVTLASLGAALGLTQVITGGVDLQAVPTNLVDTLGNGEVFGVPYLVVVAFVVTAIGAIILNTTRFGQHTIAVGSNLQAADRSDIRVNRHLTKVYLLQGLLAGLAGFLSLARFGNTQISSHSADNLAVIAAVVLGGTSLFGGIGSVTATMIAVFIPAALQNGFVIIGLQPYWQGVAIGVVLVLAVYVDARRRRTRNRE